MSDPRSRRTPHPLLAAFQWHRMLLLALAIASAGISARAQRTLPVPVAPEVLRVGTIEHYALIESSGLTASPRHPGVFWSHNDTENPSFLFAIRQNGEHVGAYEVKGANLIDWEATAADEAGYLYFADTGTNGMARSHSAVHRVEEPDISEPWGPAQVVRTWYIRFPGQREDCEGIFILDGHAYLVGKYPVNGRVPLYRFSLADTSESILLELVTLIPMEDNVSDIDLAPDRTRLAFLTDEGVTTLFIDGNPASAARAPRRDWEYDNSSMEGGTWVDNGFLVVSEGLPEILLFTSPFLAGGPVFTSSLEDQVAFVGERIQFEAAAAGFPAPTYQWHFESQPIPGQTSSILTLTNLALTNSGVYELTASNIHGITRTSATLTVLEREADLRITEVMSSEAPNTLPTADWWELTNFGNATNDLSGWRSNDGTGGIADAFVIPDGVLIRPGETIVFVEDLTPEQFREWWGPANFATNLQIVTFVGAELSFSALGDTLRLWDAEATSDNDLAARVEFGVPEVGVSFTFNPETGAFGEMSQLGVDGAFRAASSTDIGSPGTAPAPEEELNIEGRITGSMFEIQFNGEAGQLYSLEATGDLASGIWEPTGQILDPANTSSNLFQNPRNAPARFYRLRKMDSP